MSHAKRVLLLYRDLLKNLKTAYPSYGGTGPRDFIKSEIRSKFRQNRHETDSAKLKKMILEAETQLQMLKRSSYKIYVSPSLKQKEKPQDTTRPASSNDTSRPLFLGQGESHPERAAHSAANSSSPRQQPKTTPSSPPSGGRVQHRSHQFDIVPPPHERAPTARPANRPAAAPAAAAPSRDRIQHAQVGSPPRSMFSSAMEVPPVLQSSPRRSRSDPLVTPAPPASDFLTPAEIALKQWNDGDVVRPVNVGSLKSNAPSTSSKPSSNEVLPAGFVQALKDAAAGPWKQSE